MRDPGLDSAIKAAGGVGALARMLGIAQPSVSNWTRVPAERVAAVEAATGVPRHTLRPDLFAETDSAEVDEIDRARAELYGLIASLIGKAPTADTLTALAQVKGSPTPIGVALLQLADAARAADLKDVTAAYFTLFVGVGRSELLPYASYYLTGFLNERPLAKVRGDLAEIGIERAEHLKEPEDHIAILAEVMAGLAGGRIAAPEGFERRFFERHLQPFAARFFADLENAPSADAVYRAVGTLGRLYMDIEAEAYALAA